MIVLKKIQKNNIFLVDFIVGVVYINICCDIDSVEA